MGKKQLPDHVIALMDEAILAGRQSGLSDRQINDEIDALIFEHLAADLSPYEQIELRRDPEYIQLCEEMHLCSTN